MDKILTLIFIFCFNAIADFNLPSPQELLNQTNFSINSDSAVIGSDSNINNAAISSYKTSYMCPVVEFENCGSNDVMTLSSYSSTLFTKDKKGFFCPQPESITDTSNNPLTDEFSINRIQLSGIDLVNGNYSCVYYTKEKNEPLVKCDYQNTKCSADLLKFDRSQLNKFQSGTIDFEIFYTDKIRDDLKKYIFGNSDGLYQKIKNIDKANVVNVYDYVNMCNQSNIFDLTVDCDNPSLFDVNDNPRLTVSYFLTGLVTLNPSVVEGVEGGKIKYNSKIEEALSNSSKNNEIEIEEDVGFLKKGWNWLVGDDRSEAQKFNEQYNSAMSKYLAEGKLNSFIDFFDKAVFGLFAMINSAIQIPLMYISVLLFTTLAVSGGVTFALKNGIQKTLASAGERIDWQNADKSKVFGFPILLIVFFVPISTGIKIPQGNYELEIKSTTIQKMMGYYGFGGNNIATITSDNIYVTFLDWKLQNETVTSLDAIVLQSKNLYREMVIHQKTKDFYQMCYGLYEDRLNINKSFRSSLNSNNLYRDWIEGGARYNLSTSFNVSYRDFTDWNGKYDGSEFGYFFIDPRECYSLEKSILMQRDKIGRLYKNILDKLKIADSSKKSEALKFITLNMLLLQEKMGWINIITLPTVYFFLKSAGLLQLYLDEYDNIEKASKEMAKDMFYHKEDMTHDRSLYDDLNEFGDSSSLLINQGIGFLTSMYVYNILPGFNPIQSGLYDFFINSKISSTIILGIIDKLSLMPSMLNISQRANRFFDFSRNNEGATSAIIDNTVGFFGSYWLAKEIYNFGISILFIVLISLTILLKILYFFIEVIYHFLVTTFQIFWAMKVTKEWDKLMLWLKRTIILLTFKPLIIVLVSVFFIFAYELFVSIYYMSIGFLVENLTTIFSLYNVADISDDSMYSFFAYMQITTIEETFNIMLYPFLIILAFKLIIGADEQILNQWGDSDSSQVGNQMKEFLAKIEQRTGQ